VPFVVFHARILQVVESISEIVAKLVQIALFENACDLGKFTIEPMIIGLDLVAFIGYIGNAEGPHEAPCFDIIQCEMVNVCGNMTGTRVPVVNYRRVLGKTEFHVILLRLLLYMEIDAHQMQCL
jgi:hypothetical protein